MVCGIYRVEILPLNIEHTCAIREKEFHWMIDHYHVDEEVQEAFHLVMVLL